MPTHCHHHQSMVSSDARLVLVRHALSTYSLSTSQAVATSADNRSDSANNTPPPFIHLDGTEKRGTFAELLSTSTIHLHVQPNAGTLHLSSVTTSLASMIRLDTITYDTYTHDIGYTNWDCMIPVISCGTTALGGGLAAGMRRFANADQPNHSALSNAPLEEIDVSGDRH